MDYRDEWHNGHHVMLDSELLVTVRWKQVKALAQATHVLARHPKEAWKAKGTPVTKGLSIVEKFV